MQKHVKTLDEMRESIKTFSQVLSFAYVQTYCSHQKTVIHCIKVEYAKDFYAYYYPPEEHAQGYFEYLRTIYEGR